MKHSLRAAVIAAIAAAGSAAAQAPPSPFAEREQKALAEPFVGITTDGQPVPGLFPLAATGVSTAPVIDATRAWLDALTPAQRAAASFAVDDIEWRKWMNVHRYARQGVSFRDMDARQRELAFALLRAGLSARGFSTARDIMRLNARLGELATRPEEYGEDLYWLTVMGEPSAEQPWGWQLDGHHLIVNYFVLKDQVVMTPTFMGSEPVSATAGPHEGVIVLQAEQDQGLAFVNALDPARRAKAILDPVKTSNNNLAEGFKDNVVVPHQGLGAMEMSAEERARFMALIMLYVGTIGGEHAQVKMREVMAHLDETRFAWIGGTDADAVFYYRIHSPVILIEFDHQSPANIPTPPDQRKPTRAHIHTVMRTPNGNDYGKDLLRQHYEAHRDDPAHGHRQ
ncbi:MAG: DUF3500 domain-containing protein [Rhodospirillaceae bacterium]|nr:DUF3500 domain-containing protein [Rhodospirillaceae bacterium]